MRHGSDLENLAYAFDSVEAAAHREGKSVADMVVILISEALRARVEKSDTETTPA